MRPYIDFQSLKQIVTVPMVLRHLGWPISHVEPKGFRGPCPIHRSHTLGSRSLSCTNVVWKCWVCNKSGDVCRLWGLVHRCDDYQAALQICEVFHVAVPLRRTRTPREQ